MLMKAAERMIRCLVKKEIIDPFLYDVYLYGCETVLYTIVSTAGLIVTGILLQYTWETIILVGVFYLNQSLGGGFHANTHIRCFFTMLLGLICAFFLIDLHLPRWSLIVIGAGSVGILLYFSNIYNQKSNKYRSLDRRKPNFPKKCCKTESVYCRIYNICCPRKFLKFLHTSKRRYTAKIAESHAYKKQVRMCLSKPI